MKISVIEAERIGGCLASIARQPGPHEAIVADGGSTDATRELARAHAAVLEAPRGRARQMNAGARRRPATRCCSCTPTRFWAASRTCP